MPAHGNLQIVDLVIPNAVATKPSLIGVVGELFATELPAEVNGLHCHWIGTFKDAAPASEHEVRLEFVQGDEHQPLIAAKFRMNNPNQLFAFHTALPPVRVMKEGWGKFAVLVDNEEAGYLELPVRKIQIQ